MREHLVRTPAEAIAALKKLTLSGEPGVVIRYEHPRCAYCRSVLTSTRCESCGAPR